MPIPLALTYAHLRRFHGAAAYTLVATPSMMRQLEARGVRNLALWSRGVDTEIFRPRGKQFLDLPRPIWLYFGRIAVEKGVEDFLELQLPGSKLVVGDGPATALLKQRFPQAHYAGYRYGEELARYVSCADVFVFPSRTDTFGLVLLEAMACGVPVAAYPVTGPCDVVLDGVTGALSDDLEAAAMRALTTERRRLPPPCAQVHVGGSDAAARRAPGRSRRRARAGELSAEPAPSSVPMRPAPADSCRAP